ncbi:unnamed protein product [Diabrotica balteata]|uniref:Uncharacterized protein n=1 Tax=Diabrotica balteata TaxID=107213 RepID=A0A9N9T4Z0_DIABA|nr:unnamed protein product [Diabrotica balteata]
MRREDRTKVPVTNPNEEFVDILQVQQLLLNETRREQQASSQASLSQTSAMLVQHQSHGRAVEVPPGYYYGAYPPAAGPSTPTSTSVDELVAMWFSGSQATASGHFVQLNTGWSRLYSVDEIRN